MSFPAAASARLSMVDAGCRSALPGLPRLPKFGFELALIGFVLGSFFVPIAVFGVKTRKIGFVLQKRVNL